MSAAGTDPAAAPGSGLARLPSQRRLGAFSVTAAALAIGILFPLLEGGAGDEGTMSIAFYVLIFMASVTAWNIFSGYSGYLALGHVAFFGTGAYAMALMQTDWHVAAGWPTMWLLPLCGLVAGLFAIPIGLVALRTRRHTFVVLTIAVVFIFQTLATNLAFTGGTGGHLLTAPSWLYPVYNVNFYYVALVLTVFAVALSWGVRRSRFGLQLMAIRDDEDRARGMGVRTTRVKLTAFTISAIPVGMAGGLYAYFLNGIYPAGSGGAFDPLFDISLALMGFLGGFGTISGPLLGALLLEALQQKLTQVFSTDGLYLIIDGALFLLVLLLLPRGIVPSVSDRLRYWRAEHGGRAAEPSAGATVAKVAP
jgi:branched-chain amino acid transport system permease protein